MPVAIMSAMAEEIELYLDTCTIVESCEQAGLTFHESEYDGHDLVLVKAGVGKVNAAMCTQMLVDIFNVDAVICTGSAGALHDGLDIGDVVIAEDCVQHDMRVAFLGLPPGQIPFSDLRFFTADPPLVEQARDVDLAEHTLHVGRVCTGDTFIQDEARRNEIRDELKGDCVEMEGAAVGQVCTLNDVPFLLVRAISDRADGSSDVDFQDFLEEAAQSSARIVLHLLEVLPATSSSGA